jgi:hypothetical protein
MEEVHNVTYWTAAGRNGRAFGLRRYDIIPCLLQNGYCSHVCIHKQSHYAAITVVLRDDVGQRDSAHEMTLDDVVIVQEADRPPTASGKWDGWRCLYEMDCIWR